MTAFTGGLRASVQDQLSLFTVDMPDPFHCPYERQVIDCGGVKTFCALRRLWTNCREWGSCTATDAQLELG